MRVTRDELAKELDVPLECISEIDADEANNAMRVLLMEASHVTAELHTSVLMIVVNLMRNGMRIRGQFDDHNRNGGWRR